MDKGTVDKQLITYQERAMRTLGFAYQVLENDDTVIENDKLIAGSLHFIGIAAIADPVRADVPNAVKECLNAGINIKIVTGDTPGTAKEIGRQIGLWSSTDTDNNIITGPEFEELTDEQTTRPYRGFEDYSSCPSYGQKTGSSGMEQMGYRCILPDEL